MEGNQQDVSHDELIVALGVFSGRPNPAFNLDRDDAAQLAEMVQGGVGKEAIHPPPLPKLGEFHGFYISVPGELAKSLHIPEKMRIVHGVIAVPQEGEERHWRDGGHVADFLTDRAFSKGFGEFLEHVGVKRPGGQATSV